MYDVISLIIGVIEETESAVYHGATLVSNGLLLNIDGYTVIETNERFKYVGQEKYMWCKCYIKYKNEKSSYWFESKDFISNWEYCFEQGTTGHGVIGEQ